MKKFIFILMCIFTSSASLATSTQVLEDINEKSSLQYFGFWGGYYWDIGDSGPNGSHLFENFLGLASNTEDKHLIGVAGVGTMYSTECGSRLSKKLDHQLCIIEHKLDDIISRNDRGNYNVLLGMEKLFYEKNSVPGEKLKNWETLIDEANYILSKIGKPEIIKPNNFTASPATKNQAAIKAVVSALSQQVFEQNPERLELIEILSVIDEPYLGIKENETSISNMFSSQRWILWELNKSLLKDKKTYVNFVRAIVWNSGTNLRDIIPFEYDYVSFNCYRGCSFDRHWDKEKNRWDKEKSIVHTTQKLINEKWPHQKVIMIPYAGASLNTHQCSNPERYPWVTPHVNWVNSYLIRYFNFAAQNTEVVGLLPFFWHDRLTKWCGAYRFQNQIETLSEISTKITDYSTK